MALPLICEIYLNNRIKPKVNVEESVLNIIQHTQWKFNVKQDYPDLLPREIAFIRFCIDTNTPHTEQDIKNSLLTLTEKKPGKFIKYVNCLYVTLEEGQPSVESMDNNDGDSATTSSNNWLLPNKAFDDEWENLFFEDNTKEVLLRYAMTCLQLGRFNVNPNVILCNRLILLHGPPGTGKTTICRALAQKLSIRMESSFALAQLVEINCHSLFSKWFSESGKLVSKMFSTIREYAENKEILVVVLIDEVESLTAARHAAINSNEPSDAIRVVNAVLTQLDALRYFGNVLILATSNLTDAIDSAFTDRADIIKYVGLPGVEARKLIINSCLGELRRAGVLISTSDTDVDGELMAVVDACDGLSGRTIRKLPVLAFSQIIASYKNISIIDFVHQLLMAAHQLRNERMLLNKDLVFLVSTNPEVSQSLLNQCLRLPHVTHKI